MDQNASVLQVRHGERVFHGFRSLKRITEHNVTPERLKWVWDRVCDCPYASDDFARGDVGFFLAQFANPENEFYEAGDEGLYVVSKPIERGSADVHYLVWDHALGMRQWRARTVELFDYLFYDRRVHHLVGYIPSNNQSAIRFAQSVGMRFEGEIRENFKYYGRYFSTHIYGILDREYDISRVRLV